MSEPKPRTSASSLREHETPSTFLSVQQPGHGQAGSSATSVVTGDDAAAAEKGQSAASPEEPPRKVKGPLWILVVTAILSSVFLFALDNTIVADLQADLIGRFGNIEKLPWLGVAFLLGAVATNLLWGKIFAQFNAKHMYLFNLLLFEAGSAICGAANSMDMLIGGRAIAGVGGAGMYVGVMTLLSVTTTEHERPVYIGLTGLVWGAGTVLGPIIGGAFAESSATWRWAFYINLVLGAVFTPVYLFLLPSYDPRPGVPVKERVKELDYVGATLLVGAFISGVMAISFGGNLYAWNSGRIIGLFVTSGVLFIVVGVQQTYTIFTTQARRIFPIHFLKSRTMVILFAMTASAVTVAFVAIYFIPLFFQFVKGDSPLDAGVRLLPLVCLMVFAILCNGVVMSKYGLYMPWYLVGGILSIVGGALMYTVDGSTSTAAIYGYSIIIGVGSGAYAQTSFSVAQVKVKPEEVPLAVGFITCGQVGGATIALAISNSVFLNQSTKKIVELLPDASVQTVRTAIAGAGSDFFNSLTTETRQRVLDIIVEAIGKVYILAITAGALTVVLSLFLKRERLFMEMGAVGA